MARAPFIVFLGGSRVVKLHWHIISEISWVSR